MANLNKDKSQQRPQTGRSNIKKQPNQNPQQPGTQNPNQEGEKRWN